MRKKILFHLVLLSFIFLFNSCEDNFNPIKEEYLDNYSIFGYLDAEADTQWIRIMPIRESIYKNIDSLDAKVTLTELGGTSVELTAKAIYFGEAVGNTIQVWNYWTTMDIKPESEYLISVQNGNGELTQIRVKIPSDFNPPEVSGSLIYLNSMERLADIRAVWTVRDNVKRETLKFSFSHINKIEVTVDGHKLNFDPNKDFLKITEIIGNENPYLSISNGELLVVKVEFEVVQAGENWIDFFNLNREEIAVETIKSNVKGGVGYIVGTVIKKVNFKVCVGDAFDIIACNNP